MSELAGLWLPIVLSSIAVFFASFLAWVVVGHHTPDWREIAEEGKVVDFIRAQGLRPGQYVFPMARSKVAMADPEKRQRMTSGPWGTLNIWSRQVNMGSNLLKSFTFYLITSFFIAYLGTLALDAGATFSKVFQVTGTAGILAYAFGHVPNSIWFGTHRRPMLMDILDGVCFGLVTGLIFAAFWP